MLNPARMSRGNTFVVSTKDQLKKCNVEYDLIKMGHN